MPYFETLIADGAYHSDKPLTYSSKLELPVYSTVSVPLRNKTVIAVITHKVKKPSFATQGIKAVISKQPIPEHLIELAKWLSRYYNCTLGDSLRLMGPAALGLSRLKTTVSSLAPAQTELVSRLTDNQESAIKNINASRSTTVLLHGDTGTGKTRVYLELAKQVLSQGKSIILLTPEISLTAQLAESAKAFLAHPIHIFHSQLTAAARKKLWLEIIDSSQPLIIVGARSALFAPLKDLGLIVVDEAHEPAYKQDGSPRYQATRVASKLGELSGAKVIFGSATPELSDYYLASAKKAVVRMTKPAIKGAQPRQLEIVDLRDRSNFGSSSYLSLKLIDEIKTTISAKKQVIIYLNRRGSARLILCNQCGWQMLCPNCDIPFVYHGDEHLVRCHTCGYKTRPPLSCPVCSNHELIYRSAGTKSLTDEISRLFPDAKVRRFDSDNLKGERLDEQYQEVKAGAYDVLVGTQLLAKGLDLPHLGMVGVIAAESSLGLPDYSAEERAFQLLYQIIGRVGRGHTGGKVIIQTFQPESRMIMAAANRDYKMFYMDNLAERKTYGFPPFVYLAQLICKRASAASANEAAAKLRTKLARKKLAMQIIGPATPLYARRGNAHYCQLVLKAKNRGTLLTAISDLPSGWQTNLDPINLL